MWKQFLKKIKPDRYVKESGENLSEHKKITETEMPPDKLLIGPTGKPYPNLIDANEEPGPNGHQFIGGVGPLRGRKFSMVNGKPHKP